MRAQIEFMFTPMTALLIKPANELIGQNRVEVK